MFDKKNIFSLQEKLSNLRSILILLPPQPDLEIALSAIGLLLTFQQTGKQVQLGCIPYYMFVVRDTGAQHYFGIPLVKAYEIFNKAYSSD